jgi:hypothetical protein
MNALNYTPVRVRPYENQKTRKRTSVSIELGSVLRLDSDTPRAPYVFAPMKTRKPENVHQLV